eukprot:CAMPEP_0117648056 /NCGR_PEP_ID=MMETSP0804-20121206/184_1 /TAXON_ID=1074897 /ORGANISM="Tetraselmis astigmatica, Strain CCMP880" /LENGTH=87 /DNA_ID=CAMNT_0005453599 /DNA_START=749 /DNA_END=1012 /DNA_ORIENTATION=-
MLMGTAAWPSLMSPSERNCSGAQSPLRSTMSTKKGWSGDTATIMPAIAATTGGWKVDAHAFRNVEAAFCGSLPHLSLCDLTEDSSKG